MKAYNSFEDIEKDLIRYKLERQIALEELKLIKSDFKKDLMPYNLIKTGASLASKFGLMLLIKKILK